MVSAGHRRLADLWARVLVRSGPAVWALCGSRARRRQHSAPWSAARPPEWQMAQRSASRTQPWAQDAQPATGRGRAGSSLGDSPYSVAAPAGRYVSAGFLPFLPSWLLVISPDLLALGLERCHGAVNCPEEDTGSSQRIGSNSFPCSLCVRQSRWPQAEWTNLDRRREVRRCRRGEGSAFSTS